MTASKYTTRRTPATGGPCKCEVCGTATSDLVVVLAGELCVSVTCSGECASARITELMLRYPVTAHWTPCGPQLPAKAFLPDEDLVDLVFTPQACVAQKANYTVHLAEGDATIDQRWAVVRKADLIVQSNGWAFKDRNSDGRMVSSAECALPYLSKIE